MSDVSYFLSGCSLGFLGSFHCVGMCGPLALALPAHTISSKKALIGRVFYNMGRVSVYIILGIIFFYFGELLYLHKFQNSFSIVLGFLCILFFISNLLGKKKILHLPKWIQSFIQKPLYHLYKQESFNSFFLIGILNGLLPCGFVYMALTASLSITKLYACILFMLGFGLGTWPAMMAISIGLRLFPQSYQKFFLLAQPIFILLTGLILIFYGVGIHFHFFKHSHH